jgi:hypothetical protein
MIEQLMSAFEASLAAEKKRWLKEMSILGVKNIFELLFCNILQSNGMGTQITIIAHKLIFPVLLRVELAKTFWTCANGRICVSSVLTRVGVRFCITNTNSIKLLNGAMEAHPLRIKAYPWARVAYPGAMKP